MPTIESGLYGEYEKVTAGTLNLIGEHFQKVPPYNSK